MLLGKLRSSEKLSVEKLVIKKKKQPIEESIKFGAQTNSIPEHVTLNHNVAAITVESTE